MHRRSAQAEFKLEPLEQRVLLSAAGLTGAGAPPGSVAPEPFVAEVQSSAITSVSQTRIEYEVEVGIGSLFGELAVDDLELREERDDAPDDDSEDAPVSNASRSEAQADAVFPLLQAVQCPGVLLNGESVSAERCGLATGGNEIPRTEAIASLVTSNVTVNAAADLGQLVYLKFDGASDVTYNGPVSVEGVEVKPFQAPAAFDGRETDVINGVVDFLTGTFAGFGVEFTVDRPAEGQTYSTIYVGGDGSAFADYGLFLGLSEKIDEGNLDPGDNAFVFSDNMAYSWQTDGANENAAACARLNSASG